MVTKKSIRTKGKLPFSRYFQRLNQGDFVAVIVETSLKTNFPKSLQGRTGKIEGKKGRSYLVRIEKKQYIINPVHLKKIQTI